MLPCDRTPNPRRFRGCHAWSWCSSSSQALRKALKCIDSNVISLVVLLLSPKLSCVYNQNKLCSFIDKHLLSHWMSSVLEFDRKRELQMLLCRTSLVVTLRTPHMVLFTSCKHHTKWPKDDYVCKGVSMLTMIKHHFMMWWWCQPKWWFDELTTNQGGSEAILYIFSPLDHLWVLPLPLRKLLVVF